MRMNMHFPIAAVVPGITGLALFFTPDNPRTLVRSHPICLPTHAGNAPFEPW